MLCDSQIDESTIFFYEKGQETPEQTSKTAAIYLSQSMGEYFLNQCLDFIELRNHVVRRLNLELLLSLCDKEGNFIARDKKQDWKKVLPSLTNSDMEYIQLCKK